MATPEINEDMIVMKDGKVMTMRKGKLTPVPRELTMPDGTRILLDGTVLMTNGSSSVMAEGETMHIGRGPADTPAMPDLGPTEDMTGTETHDPT